MSKENESLGYYSKENFEKLTNTNEKLFNAFEKILKRDIFKPYKVDTISKNISNINNIKYVHFLCNRMGQFYSDFKISTYLKHHIMYMVILDLDITKINLSEKTINELNNQHKNWKNVVLIKIGYTYDIQDRISELKTKFKCNIYILSLKYVNSQGDETFFHNKILKKSYKNTALKLITDIDNKLKTLSDETYIGTIQIMSEFDEFNVNINNELLVEQAKNKRMETENILKENEIIIKENEIIIKDKDIILKEKEKELLEIKFKNEIELKNKDIELLKLQIKLKKLEK